MKRLQKLLAWTPQFRPGSSNRLENELFPNHINNYGEKFLVAVLVGDKTTSNNIIASITILRWWKQNHIMELKQLTKFLNHFRSKITYINRHRTHIMSKAFNQHMVRLVTLLLLNHSMNITLMAANTHTRLKIIWEIDNTDYDLFWLILFNILHIFVFFFYLENLKKHKQH